MTDDTHETTAVAARAAVAEDPTSDVLVLGTDFHYLAVDRDGAYQRVASGPTPDAPSRIVVDADSFLAGGGRIPATRDEDPPLRNATTTPLNDRCIAGR